MPAAPFCPAAHPPLAQHSRIASTPPPLLPGAFSSMQTLPLASSQPDPSLPILSISSVACKLGPQVMAIAQMIARDFPDSGASLSGIGGINTGRDAAEFLLLGAGTVQVCTGVMLHGYGLVKYLAGGLQAFMDKHGFTSVEQFRGGSLPYFTSHRELVRRQHEALEIKKKERVGLAKDDQWTGDGFVQEAASMVAN